MQEIFQIASSFQFVILLLLKSFSVPIKMSSFKCVWNSNWFQFVYAHFIPVSLHFYSIRMVFVILRLFVLCLGHTTLYYLLVVSFFFFFVCCDFNWRFCKYRKNTVKREIEREIVKKSSEHSHFSFFFFFIQDSHTFWLPFAMRWYFAKGPKKTNCLCSTQRRRREKTLKRICLKLKLSGEFDRTKTKEKKKKKLKRKSMWQSFDRWFFCLNKFWNCTLNLCVVFECLSLQLTIFFFNCLFFIWFVDSVLIFFFL